MQHIDQYTCNARDVSQQAVEIMKRYGHLNVDSEHVLLAMLEQPDGTIPRILAHLDVDANLLHSSLDKLLSAKRKFATSSSVNTKQVFITPRVKRALDQATIEEDLRQVQYVSTLHLLLGILHEPHAPAVSVLSEHGVTKARIQDAVKEVVDDVQVAGDCEPEKHYPDDVNAAIERLAQYIRQSGFLEMVVSRTGATSLRCSTTSEESQLRKLTSLGLVVKVVCSFLFFPSAVILSIVMLTTNAFDPAWTFVVFGIHWLALRAILAIEEQVGMNFISSVAFVLFGLLFISDSRLLSGFFLVEAMLLLFFDLTWNIKPIRHWFWESH